MGVNNGSGVPSSNQNISKGAVVIAVAATASVTFSISLLLFLFWLCCCRPNSSRHKAKDKPHILLSSNRYSTATPHKPFSFVTVANEQILRNRSFYDNLNHKVSGNIFIESHSLGNSIPVVIVSGNAANSVENSLQMPPGMSSAPKSPPGEPPPERIYPPTPPPGNATSPTSIPVLPTPTTPPTEPSSSAPCPPSPLPPPAKPSPGVSCPPSPPHPPPRPSSGVSYPPSPPPPPPRPSSGVSCSSSPPPPPSRPSSGTPCPPPPGPPPVLKAKNSLHPPPPPSACVPPPIGLKPSQRVPSAPHHSLASSSVGESEAGAAKAKLKPLFWDKVMANPDHSMVWDHIRSGSFHFNEEMIENLFVYEPAGKNKNDRRKESSSQDAALQHIQLIDPKKSQILSIMLKASNVATHDVCAAIKKGNQLLPPELIQALLKMTPTTGEQIRLQEYTGELSQLSLAEQLLKVLVDIPFVFKRLESMLFLCTLPEDISMLRESFAVLEVACTELRESRLFLRLLEAVLKTGNRMNDGTFRGGAQAFKLDTLLKLSDVKGTDGKTTLLHFVVQEIILSEGKRAARLTQGSGSISNFKSDDLSEDSNEDSGEYLRSTGLQVISGLGNELNNVKKAATLDIDTLTTTVSKLRNEVNESRALLNSMKNVAEENSFCQALMSNLQNAENDVSWSVEEEKRIESLVKSMGDYFHGNAGKHEGAGLFKIVREFLAELDKVCEEVKKSLAKGKQNIPKRRKDITATSLAHGSLTSVIPS